MYKILVAEDETIERKVLCRALNNYLGEACRIYEARNGREALALARQERPQLAILDIQMPGISGLDVARSVRQEGLPCAVLFLTAFDNFTYTRQAIAVRAVDYLLKPYDEQELLSSVDAALQRTEPSPYPPSSRPAGAENAAPQKSPSPSGEDSALPGESAEPENLRLGRIRTRILEYIETNYAREISMQDAAEAMSYSDAYFCKLFKRCFRVNFSAYLNQYRVERAKQLLADPALGVREISSACGYSDPNYFARVFKRLTGSTPSEYRAGAHSR